jgi:trehalose/maltose hydrolase-like predicted phosphorylase
VDTNISEELADSIVTEDRDSSYEKLLSTHKTAWYHNLKDHNVNLHCYDNLKSCTM